MYLYKLVQRVKFVQDDNHVSLSAADPSVIHFFHFSICVNLVIGRPLTPHVPTPTFPVVRQSGDAKILFFTLPLVVLDNTYKQTMKH